ELALYFLDATPTNAHGLKIDIYDAGTGTLLDHQTVTGFGAGKYLIWAVRGAVRISIGSLDAGKPVLSGLFVDPNSNTGPEVSIVAPQDGTIMMAPTNLIVESFTVYSDYAIRQ